MISPLRSGKLVWNEFQNLPEISSLISEKLLKGGTEVGAILLNFHFFGNGNLNNLRKFFRKFLFFKKRLKNPSRQKNLDDFSFSNPRGGTPE